MIDEYLRLLKLLYMSNIISNNELEKLLGLQYIHIFKTTDNFINNYNIIDQLATTEIAEVPVLLYAYNQLYDINNYDIVFYTDKYDKYFIEITDKFKNINLFEIIPVTIDKININKILQNFTNNKIVSNLKNNYIIALSTKKIKINVQIKDNSLIIKMKFSKVNNYKDETKIYKYKINNKNLLQYDNLNIELKDLDLINYVLNLI